MRFFSEFNRQSRKVQHSPFFPALGTKPPGEEKCTGVKDRRGNEPGDERRAWRNGVSDGDDKEIA